jgi:hypothetical protein
MALNPNPDYPRNFLVIVLFMIVTLFTAFQEGYFPLISVSFWLYLLAGFVLCFWLACFIFTKHLLALILTIFIIENIKETIGIVSGLWVYHGIQGSYNFGIWCWVLGGLSTYTLATRIIIRWLRKLTLPVSRPGNARIVVALFGLIPLTLMGYWQGTGLWFWSFYLLLLLICLGLTTPLDFPVLASMVVSSWLVGIPGEYLGAISSHAWTFPLNPRYPPFYLVICCWPLEILAQQAIAALLTNQSLNPLS